MEDTDLLQMFESLIATGLKNFLGCPAVFNDDALTEFFVNSSVREDELVVSTVNGVSVEISEEVFAATFELPIEGLTDFSEVPKNLVFDARSLFSISKEQVSISCLKKAMKIQYRLLHDILAKTIYVKAGSFDSVTRDRFMLMTAITFDVKINWSSLLFRVLREKVTPGSRLPVEEPVGVSTTSEQPVTEVATGEREPVEELRIASITEATTRDADAAIEQVLAQLDLVIQDSDFERGDRIETWFDRAFDEEFATADQENRDSEDEIDFYVDNQALPVFDETRTVPEAGGSKSFGVDKAGEKAIGSTHSTEEHMSIDDLLMQISEDMMLPSVTAVEITKIRLGGSINIHEVQERDLYYASLARISIHDKGKEILEEDEPDLKAKESLMLNWAETDSLEMAVRRRVYILAKYREMLLRKFLESHRKYLVPGQPWTATASQIIDLLSAAHSKTIEVLLIQQKEHGLPIEQPCTSTCHDTSIGSGAVLAQFFSQAKSKCWVRPMVLIDGVWTPIQGNDFLRSSCKLSLFVNRKKLPKSVVEEEFVPHYYLIEPVQYWGAAPSLIKTWGWARVGTEIIRYSMFGCLRPVCQEIVVYNLGVERIPDYLLSDFQRVVCTDTCVGFFSGSSVQTDSEIELSSSDGDTVYRSPSPILQEIDSFEENLQFDLGPVVSTNALEEQLYCVEILESPPPIPQRQESSSSSSDSQMNFDTTDFPLDDTTEAQTLLSAATVEAIDDLRAVILQRIDDSNSAILSKLHTLERGLRDALHDQDDNARKLINSVCQDAQTISDVQKIHLNDVKKIVLAQGVTAGADSLEIRKAINAVDAKILLLDGQVATIRSEHLEFQARISTDLLGLSTQIGDLVDYIRSGDAKKGEGSSSRHPLPTPVHHSEGTGDVVRLTEPTQAYIDNANRAILERMRNEDYLRSKRERDRARRERRLSRSGAYKRRRGF
ncbi:hypothetical protein F511_43243 [Dorcoceras hygrometricum]|uniref:Dystroglycan-like n=1 Tax=Dorcoceras hygrometricum TaxID=472368 RepID=A0A2Z7C7F4_9LAMI|nr:hypothetical protein F511_43243 [Dorcoceras hygrometricum]